MDDAADDDPWRRACERAREVMAAVAAGGRTITYDALRRQLGDLAPAGRGDRDLAALLRSVSIAEDDAGRGLLSAVVVRPGGRPGPGWFRLARERGRHGDPDHVWRDELDRVHRAHGRRPS